MLALETIDELRSYVREVLCRQADLEPATPLYEAVLTARGVPVAAEFTLLGPRSVRLSAIWDPQASRVLFYDQDLQRFDTCELDKTAAPAIGDFVPEPIPVKSLWKGK